MNEYCLVLYIAAKVKEKYFLVSIQRRHSSDIEVDFHQHNLQVIELLGLPNSTETTHISGPCRRLRIRRPIALRYRLVTPQTRPDRVKLEAHSRYRRPIARALLAERLAT